MVANQDRSNTITTTDTYNDLPGATHRLGIGGTVFIRGYGTSLKNVEATVIVVVDLDDRDCLVFKRELASILDACDPQPSALFRIAIEEMEAWILGDQVAVKSAYPSVKLSILNSYVQDSISGTWEILANAIHSGGAKGLKKLGYPEIERAKYTWAGKIAPHKDIYRNQSRSFRAFRDGVLRLAGCDG